MDFIIPPSHSLYILLFFLISIVEQVSLSPYLVSNLGSRLSHDDVQTYSTNVTVNILKFQTNFVGVAPITQLRTCVIKIVTFKGGHLMW